MCGRYTLRTRLTVLAKQFKFDLGPGFEDVVARYNVAPSQQVLAVRVPESGAKRQLVRLKWGLIPVWAKDAKIAYSTINARADTVATKPAFRSAFKKRRCLVLADGYYEWHTEGKEKQPFLFELDGITTEANELCAEVHDRMPVILDATDYDSWLDAANSDPSLLLRPLDPGRMTTRPVSKYVSNAKHEGAECIAPISP